MRVLIETNFSYTEQIFQSAIFRAPFCLRYQLPIVDAAKSGF